MGQRQEICRILRIETSKRQVATVFSGRQRFRILQLFDQYRTTSEKVVIAYEIRSNAEKYIKKAKYDMTVGHLLLQSIWANEAIFQLIMLAKICFVNHDGLCKWNEILIAIQTVQADVQISGRKDHLNGKNSGVETF